MTGNFKEFKVENHANDTWDEHNAMTTTAVCVSFIPEIFMYNANALIHNYDFTCFRTTLPALIVQHKRAWI